MLKIHKKILMNFNVLHWTWNSSNKIKKEWFPILRCVAKYLPPFQCAFSAKAFFTLLLQHSSKYLQLYKIQIILNEKSLIKVALRLSISFEITLNKRYCAIFASAMIFFLILKNVRISNTAILFNLFGKWYFTQVILSCYISYYPICRTTAQQTKFISRDTRHK